MKKSKKVIGTTAIKAFAEARSSRTHPASAATMSGYPTASSRSERVLRNPDVCSEKSGRVARYEAKLKFLIFRKVREVEQRVRRANQIQEDSTGGPEKGISDRGPAQCLLAVSKKVDE